MLHRNFLFIISFFIIIFSSALFADEVSQSGYQALVTKVKNGDVNIDFKTLRIAYTQTPEYDPYTVNENTALMFKALHVKEYSKALEYAKLILTQNYVDIDAHYVAETAYEELGDKKNSEFHHAIASGLIQSIKSGNGSSPQSALQVISTREEYIMLSVSGLQLLQQKLQQLDGKSYDLLHVINPDTNKEFSIYFDVTIPVNWLNQSLRKK